MKKGDIRANMLSGETLPLGQDSPLDETGEASLTMVALEIQEILTLAQQSRVELEAQLGTVKDTLGHHFEGLSERKVTLLADALKSEIQKLRLTAELRIRDRVQEALVRVKRADCRAWQCDRMVDDIKAAQKSALKEMRRSLDRLVLRCNTAINEHAAQQAQQPYAIA